MEQKQYLCIDQKSFYATVECVARGLDPMTADLVVADPDRSQNTICLAVSTHLKKRGVQNRCRIRDIPPHIKCIVAPPRMQLYIDCAAEIYGVFLKYLAPEDIYVYSIDEAFLDVTPYLKMYGLPARDLARQIMEDVKKTVGTVSACGIGTNLYLAKIALDITAKHAEDFIGILDEESYRETEKRLYEINHLKSKYGDTIESIIEYGQNAKEQYEKMLHIEEEAKRLEVELEQAKEILQKSSEELSKLRKKAAKELEESIVEALKDLNFMEVDFAIEFQEKQEFSSNGKDEVTFTISTNAGERRRPIWEVASGGELSRIMLALKSVLADMDEIETLIFDEIDVGISGRTAQKVSERMAVISKHHQVMAITHLPQIAAMADYHFLIEKNAENGKTITNIYLLKEEDQIKELARMLSGVSITDTVMESAKEMKKLAQKTKSN